MISASCWTTPSPYPRNSRVPFNRLIAQDSCEPLISQDEKSLRPVSNSYTKPLPKQLSPGKSADGLAEYSIDRKAAGGAFRMVSTRGDVTHAGETGDIRGQNSEAAEARKAE